MKKQTADKIRELKAAGLSVEAIQSAIASPVVETAQTTETRQRPADLVALEQAAIAVATRLLAAVKPGATFAQMQALPIGRIMQAVDAKANASDQATKTAILEDVARLTVLYNALSALGSEWRSAGFGAATESVQVSTRTESPSFVQAAGDDVPTLHQIREVI